MVIGVIKVVKDSGLKVFEDIVVVGFDNLKMLDIIEFYIIMIE